MQSTARWFQPSEIEKTVSFFCNQLRAARPAPESVGRAQKSERIKATIFAFALSSCAIGLFVGVLITFAEPVPGKEANYPLAAILCGGIIIGATVITYIVSGANNVQRDKRAEAIRQFCEINDDLHYAGQQEFDSQAGEVPWLLTEEAMGQLGLVVGQRPTSKILMTQCFQIIDPVSTATDLTLVKGAAQLGKHKRMYRRDLEAFVFDKELTNVPDLVIVPKKDANRGFFKHALKGQQCDVSDLYELPKPFARKYWVGSADPNRCGELLDQKLMELLFDREWCTIQVIGGRCVVLTAEWRVNRPGMAPNTPEAIAANASFAGTVFDQLHRHQTTTETYNDSVAADYDSTSALDGNDGGVAVAEATNIGTSFRSGKTATNQETKSKTTVKRQPSTTRLVLGRVILLGLGGPMILLGGLCAAVTSLDLHNGAASIDWPQVTGTMLVCEIDVQKFKRSDGAVELHNRAERGRRRDLA